MLVCDYRLPDGDTGVACAQRLRQSGFDKPIVILTGFPAPQVIREATAIDSMTVLSKDASIAELVSSLQNVLNGQPELVPSVDAMTAPMKLSTGELEVLELLNQGVTATGIAESLYLSIHAVRGRIKLLHKKLDSRSQIEAVAKATRQGILVPPN